MPQQELIIFDLDGTLAPSKAQFEVDAAGLLMKLLAKKKVAVISGARYEQFQKQFLQSLPESDEAFRNLYILPASGTQLYIWDGAWQKKYAEYLSADEKRSITDALIDVQMMSDYEKPHETFGPLIDDRESQITFSALGQDAPISSKSNWDPDQTKRNKIISLLEHKLPACDIRSGGMTSIDIHRKGMNKEYGIKKILEYAAIQPANTLFIGDALYKGGNDYPAKEMGLTCIQVKNPEETKQLISSWLQ